MAWNKESTAHRRARVAKQLRDKHGKWIEMGGGVKWYKNGKWHNGTASAFQGKNVVVKMKDGSEQLVNHREIEPIRAKGSLAPGKPAKPTGSVQAKEGAGRRKTETAIIKDNDPGKRLTTNADALEEGDEVYLVGDRKRYGISDSEAASMEDRGFAVNLDDKGEGIRARVVDASGENVVLEDSNGKRHEVSKKDNVLADDPEVDAALLNRDENKSVPDDVDDFDVKSVNPKDLNIPEGALSAYKKGVTAGKGKSHDLDKAEENFEARNGKDFSDEFTIGYLDSQHISDGARDRYQGLYHKYAQMKEDGRSPTPEAKAEVPAEAPKAEAPEKEAPKAEAKNDLPLEGLDLSDEDKAKINNAETKEEALKALTDSDAGDYFPIARQNQNKEFVGAYRKAMADINDKFGKEEEAPKAEEKKASGTPAAAIEKIASNLAEDIADIKGQKLEKEPEDAALAEAAYDVKNDAGEEFLLTPKRGEEDDEWLLDVADSKGNVVDTLPLEDQKPQEFAQAIKNSIEKNQSSDKSEAPTEAPETSDEKEEKAPEADKAEETEEAPTEEKEEAPAESDGGDEPPSDGGGEPGSRENLEDALGKAGFSREDIAKIADAKDETEAEKEFFQSPSGKKASDKSIADKGSSPEYKAARKAFEDYKHKNLETGKAEADEKVKQNIAEREKVDAEDTPEARAERAKNTIDRGKERDEARKAANTDEAKLAELDRKIGVGEKMLKDAEEKENAPLAKRLQENIDSLKKQREKLAPSEAPVEEEAAAASDFTPGEAFNVPEGGVPILSNKKLSKKAASSMKEGDKFFARKFGNKLEPVKGSDVRVTPDGESYTIDSVERKGSNVKWTATDSKGNSHEFEFGPGDRRENIVADNEKNREALGFTNKSESDETPAEEAAPEAESNEASVSTEQLNSAVEELDAQIGKIKAKSTQDTVKQVKPVELPNGNKISVTADSQDRVNYSVTDKDGNELGSVSFVAPEKERNTELMRLANGSSEEDSSSSEDKSADSSESESESESKESESESESKSEDSSESEAEPLDNAPEGSDDDSSADTDVSPEKEPEEDNLAKEAEEEIDAFLEQEGESNDDDDTDIPSLDNAPETDNQEDEEQTDGPDEKAVEDTIGIALQDMEDDDQDNGGDYTWEDLKERVWPVDDDHYIAAGKNSDDEIRFIGLYNKDDEEIATYDMNGNNYDNHGLPYTSDSRDSGDSDGRGDDSGRGELPSGDGDGGDSSGEPENGSRALDKTPEEYQSDLQELVDEGAIGDSVDVGNGYTAVYDRLQSGREGVFLNDENGETVMRFTVKNPDTLGQRFKDYIDANEALKTAFASPAGSEERNVNPSEAMMRVASVGTKLAGNDGTMIKISPIAWGWSPTGEDSQIQYVSEGGFFRPTESSYALGHSADKHLSAAELDAMSDDELRAGIKDLDELIHNIVATDGKLGDKGNMGRRQTDQDLIAMQIMRYQAWAISDEAAGYADRLYDRLKNPDALGKSFEMDSFEPSSETPQTTPDGSFPEKEWTGIRNEYVGLDHRTVANNYELRNSPKPSRGAVAWGNKMDKWAGSETLDADSMLYRSVLASPEQAAGFVPGSVVTDKGIMSVGDNAQTAAIYLRNRAPRTAGRIPILMDIQARKGEKMVAAGMGSDELVVPRGARMFIAKAEERDGVLHVTARLNPSEAEIAEWTNKSASSTMVPPTDTPETPEDSTPAPEAPSTAPSAPDAPTDVPSETTVPAGQFVKGQRVSHGKHGEGTIVRVEGNGEYARVNFDKYNDPKKTYGINLKKLTTDGTMATPPNGPETDTKVKFPEESTAKVGAWSVGERVNHGKHGVGTIQRLEGNGEFARVAFDKDGDPKRTYGVKLTKLGKGESGTPGTFKDPSTKVGDQKPKQKVNSGSTATRNVETDDKGEEFIRGKGDAPLYIGAIVIHPKFGRGRVAKLENNGKYARVIFDNDPMAIPRGIVGAKLEDVSIEKETDREGFIPFKQK